MLTDKRKKRWKVFEIFLILILSLFVCAGCEPDDDDPIDVDDSVNYCLEDISNLSPGAGPFSYTTETLRVRDGLTTAAIKMWVPRVPNGCKVPIVHHANGTTATCSMYASTLRNLAEFGFLTACYEDSNTGQGDQAIVAVEAAMSEYSIADKSKIGFTGHSQGGGGTFMAVYRAEAKWGSSKTFSGLAQEPASGFGDSPINWQSYYGQIDSPMSMFNGLYDTLVYSTWVRMAYNALPNNLFKVWYTATGLDSTHIPVPNGPTREMSIPWFRWTLLGNSDACQDFKRLPNQIGWNSAEEANLPSCY